MSGRLTWIVRPVAFHLVAGLVLIVEALGAAIGLLIGASLFDPRPFISSDNLPFDPASHPTTAGYIGEVVVASIPALAIGLLLIPVLRRAGSPAAVAASLGLDSIVVVGATLLVADNAIRDTQPGGCCTGPGLADRWWHVWVAAAIAVVVISLLSSAWALRRSGGVVAQSSP